MAVGTDLSTESTKLPPEEQARIRKLLYNQRAIPVKRGSAAGGRIHDDDDFAQCLSGGGPSIRDREGR